MQVGCGVKVRKINKHRYLYFWQYDLVDGRSVRKETYMGPAGSEKARLLVLQRLEEYHRRVEAKMRARADAYRRAMARLTPGQV